MYPKTSGNIGRKRRPKMHLGRRFYYLLRGSSSPAASRDNPLDKASILKHPKAVLTITSTNGRSGKGWRSRGKEAR